VVFCGGVDVNSVCGIVILNFNQLALQFNICSYLLVFFIWFNFSVKILFCLFNYVNVACSRCPIKLFILWIRLVDTV
jgi:hypothetical protein